MTKTNELNVSVEKYERTIEAVANYFKIDEEKNKLMESVREYLNANDPDDIEIYEFIADAIEWKGTKINKDTSKNIKIQKVILNEANKGFEIKLITNVGEIPVTTYPRALKEKAVSCLIAIGTYHRIPTETNYSLLTEMEYEMSESKFVALVLDFLKDEILECDSCSEEYGITLNLKDVNFEIDGVEWETAIQDYLSEHSYGARFTFGDGNWTTIYKN
jgi:hypothetical protein